MKSALFYIAAAVAAIVAAVFIWAKFFSTKAEGPAYTQGKGTGNGTDFMDTSKAQGGITPIKGNLGIVARGAAASMRNPWFGDKLLVKSSMPTTNPVRVQPVINLKGSFLGPLSNGN